MQRKELYLVFILFTAFSCIEPFTVPSIEGFSNLLVVDGMITDRDEEYTVTLSRSTNNIDQPVEYETDARVSVIDGNGFVFNFYEEDPGVYKSLSSEFKGEIGMEYSLLIITDDGQEYQSTFSKLLPSSQIDSIYYSFDELWSRGQESEDLGISLYVTGHVVGDEEVFFRWTFEEDWKFRIPHPVYSEIAPNNEEVYIVPENVFCWKRSNSTKVTVQSFNNLTEKKVKAKKLFTIPANQNDKLNIRYRVIVNQYSISKDEYNYWNQLKESSEDVGDVFGRQPFSISSNIKNVSNPNERVLGFFQVSSITSKELYINREDVSPKDFPQRNIFKSCPLDTVMAEFGKSLYDIYENRVLNGSQTLGELIQNEFSGKVIGLGLTSPQCSDCSLSGNPNPPKNWIEKR